MYIPSVKSTVYTDGNIPSVYTDGIIPSAYTDRFWDGIMSVGINYRRNISVGNSVAFLRFSGSVLISTFQKKTQLNLYWIKAVKGAGLGRVFVMTLQGFRAVKGWVFCGDCRGDGRVLGDIYIKGAFIYLKSGFIRTIF